MSLTIYAEDVKAIKQFLYDAYVWQKRALEKGYDMPDHDFLELQNIHKYLAEHGMAMLDWLDNVVENIKFNEEILEIIEASHPKIMQKVVNAHKAKQILKGED